MKNISVTRVMVVALLVLSLIAVPLVGACAKPAPAVKEELPTHFTFVGSGTGKVYDLSAFACEMMTKHTTVVCLSQLGNSAF